MNDLRKLRLAGRIEDRRSDRKHAIREIRMLLQLRMTVNLLWPSAVNELQLDRSKGASYSLIGIEFSFNEQLMSISRQHHVHHHHHATIAGAAT